MDNQQANLNSNNSSLFNDPEMKDAYQREYQVSDFEGDKPKQSWFISSS